MNFGSLANYFNDVVYEMDEENLIYFSIFFYSLGILNPVQKKHSCENVLPIVAKFVNQLPMFELPPVIKTVTVDKWGNRIPKGQAPEDIFQLLHKVLNVTDESIRIEPGKDNLFASNGDSQTKPGQTKIITLDRNVANTIRQKVRGNIDAVEILLHEIVSSHLGEFSPKPSSSNDVLSFKFDFKITLCGISPTSLKRIGQGKLSFQSPLISCLEEIGFVFSDEDFMRDHSEFYDKQIAQRKFKDDGKGNYLFDLPQEKWTLTFSITPQRLAALIEINTKKCISMTNAKKSNLRVLDPTLVRHILSFAFEEVSPLKEQAKEPEPEETTEANKTRPKTANLSDKGDAKSDAKTEVQNPQAKEKPWAACYAWLNKTFLNTAYRLADRLADLIPPTPNIRMTLNDDFLDDPLLPPAFVPDQKTISTSFTIPKESINEDIVVDLPHNGSTFSFRIPKTDDFLGHFRTLPVTSFGDPLVGSSANPESDAGDAKADAKDDRSGPMTDFVNANSSSPSTALTPTNPRSRYQRRGIVKEQRYFVPDPSGSMDSSFSDMEPLKVIPKPHLSSSRLTFFTVVSFTPTPLEFFEETNARLNRTLMLPAPN